MNIAAQILASFGFIVVLLLGAVVLFDLPVIAVTIGLVVAMIAYGLGAADMYGYLTIK